MFGFSFYFHVRMADIRLIYVFIVNWLSVMFLDLVMLLMLCYIMLYFWFSRARVVFFRIYVFK